VPVAASVAHEKECVTLVMVNVHNTYKREDEPGEEKVKTMITIVESNN
jgi:hypothetical protein